MCVEEEGSSWGRQAHTHAICPLVNIRVSAGYVGQYLFVGVN